MIINHKYRFIYFSIPRTACTATERHLIDRYQCERVFKKHFSFREFKKQASRKELAYFKFASIRNPLDSAVSEYFKKKTDHKGNFSRGALRNGRPMGEMGLRKFRFVQENEASFDDYFREFYNNEYANEVHEDTLRNMDYIMRFESLERDFQEFTRMMDLPYYPIPIVNSTEGKSSDYLSYYTEAIIPQAIGIFDRYMREWGYEFPAGWREMASGTSESK